METQSVVTPTPLEQKLIEVLSATGTWMSRGEIAAALNRPRKLLNNYDITCLDTLCVRQQIEQRDGVRGAVGKRYEYRMKGQT